MRRLLVCLPVAAAVLLAQYKYEPAGAPPAELAPGIRDALQKDGAKVVGTNGSVFAEVWFRAQAPTGAKTDETNVTFTTVPQGTLLGVIRFPGRGADRRGQQLKPGVYTMRLSFYPEDGDHQGVSPQRDFLILVPAADDKDLNATPAYDQLMQMSRKASGTQHPAVMSAWKPDKAQGANTLQREEDRGWVLYGNVGSLPIALIVVGTYGG